MTASCNNRRVVVTGGRNKMMVGAVEDAAERPGAQDRAPDAGAGLAAR